MSRVRPQRQIGAGALLLSAALTFTASFLPWVRITYTYQGAPAADVTEQSPGQNLVLLLVHIRHGMPFAPLSLLIEVLLIWGVPLTLAALSGAALLERHPAPTRSVRVVSLILVVVGVGFTLVSAYFMATFVLDISERSVDVVGPGVALLGYLCALVGAYSLPAAPRPTLG